MSADTRTPAQIAETIIERTESTAHVPLYLIALAESHRDLLAALKMYVAYRKSSESGSKTKRSRIIRGKVHDAIDAAIARAEGANVL